MVHCGGGGGGGGEGTRWQTLSGENGQKDGDRGKCKKGAQDRGRGGGKRTGTRFGIDLIKKF